VISAGHANPEWRTRPTHPVDSRVLFVVVTLVMIGLMVVYAATNHRGFAYLKWQGVRAVVGLLALLIGTQLRHTVLRRRVTWWLLFGSAGLLVLTLVAGVAAGSARRWLQVSILSVQPAELAKFALLVWLAAYFAGLKEAGKEWNFRNSVLKPGSVVVLVVGLTLAQPSVGTSVIMAVSCFLLFFIVGVNLKYLIPIALAGVAAVVLAISCLPYAHKRWNNFVAGNRYHQEQSLIGIGSGGPVGTGLGEGKQKFLFLPKLHNDFIFASIGEEFGFLGSLAIYFLYGLLFIRGMRISREASGHFGQYLAAGITVVIFLYALVHVAVGLGLIPTTGQPLPFVSFGGSALVTNLFAAGVLLNVSRFRRNRAVVREPSFGWTAQSRSGFSRGK